MTKKLTDAATVILNTPGGTYELVPSAAAAIALSREFGGLTGLVTAIRSADMHAITQCVVHGAQIRSGQKVQGVQNDVFAAGVGNLIEPIMRFVMLLISGGTDADA